MDYYRDLNANSLHDMALWVVEAKDVEKRFKYWQQPLILWKSQIILTKGKGISYTEICQDSPSVIFYGRNQWKIS